jgi:hypothetical protein
LLCVLGVLGCFVTKNWGGRDWISPCPTCMGPNKDGCLHFWDKSQPLIPLPHLSLLSTRCMDSGLKDQGISPTHMNRQGLKCRNQHSHPHTQELIRELRHSQFQNTLQLNRILPMRLLFIYVYQDRISEIFNSQHKVLQIFLDSTNCHIPWVSKNKSVTWQNRRRNGNSQRHSQDRATTTEHQNTTKIRPAALFSSTTHYPILPPHLLYMLSYLPS